MHQHFKIRLQMMLDENKRVCEENSALKMDAILIKEKFEETVEANDKTIHRLKGENGDLRE